MRSEIGGPSRKPRRMPLFSATAARGHKGAARPWSDTPTSARSATAGKHQGGFSAAAGGFRARTGGDLSRAGGAPATIRRRHGIAPGGAPADDATRARSSLATDRDHRLGHRAHLPVARRARRAVRARRRRGRARGAPDRPPDLLRRPAAARATTTTSCSSRRPASTPSPRSSTTTSTARSCSRCACSRCASTSCATTPGTTRSPASTTGAASIRLLEMASRAATATAGSSRWCVLDLDHFKTDQRHRGPPGRRRGAPRARRPLPPGAAHR